MRYFHSNSICIATRKRTSPREFQLYLPIVTVDYPAPASSPSYYVRNMDPSRWYLRGNSLGISDDDGRPHDRLIVLAFGYPDRQGSTYGVQLPFDATATFYSTTAVHNAVKEFARGYWVGSGSNTAAKLRIVVGTNNCCTGVALSLFQGHGTAWGQTLNSIVTSISPYSSQVSVVAGSDMEIEFNNPYTTVQWITNLMSASQCTPTINDDGCLYNFGNQTVSVPTISQGSCNSNSPSITTWAALSRYSYSFRTTLPSSGPIYFVGSLTQFARCGPVCNDGSGSYVNNAPDQGWYALMGALRNKLNTAQFVRWSTDIGLQP